MPKKKPKIFGIGLGKTGTTTLRICLETLGYDVAENIRLLENLSNDNLEPILEISKKHDAFEDFPWPFIYEEMDNKYEQSKFILTTRKSKDKWFESLKKHADRTGPTKAKKLAYGSAVPYGLKEDHTQLYEKHNERVRKYFQGREKDFLEVCWEKESGWKKICNFLGHDIPKKSFPHANSSSGKTEKVLERYLKRAKWIAKTRVNNIIGKKPWDDTRPNMPI